MDQTLMFINTKQPIGQIKKLDSKFYNYFAQWNMNLVEKNDQTNMSSKQKKTWDFSRFGVDTWIIGIIYIISNELI